MLAIQKKLTNSFYALLSLPATAVGFCLSTQVATLSWILSSKYNLHIEDVALVWLAGPLSGIIAQPIVGMMSDKSWFMGGRRKPYIVIGGILGAAMLLALPQLGFISKSTGATVFVVAVVVSLLLDMSINVTFNPARAIIADVTPAGNERTKGYSWMQVVSGTFGIGAYFISMSFGNMALIYAAAVVVLLFSIVPVLFVKEPRVLQIAQTTPKEIKSTSSLMDGIKLLLPLYGFIVFGLFVVINKMILQGGWDNIQTKVMYACLIATLLLGAFTIRKGKRQPSDSNDFQKILLAHSFSWLGIQSMFVMSYFFIREKMMPVLDTSDVFADTFSKFFTGAEQTNEQSAGNILSLGFLLLNFVGALLPVLVLEPLSKKIGKVKIYTIAIACMVAGYFLLYLAGTREIIFYLGMIICGIGWSAVISIVFAIMTEKVNANKMGMFMGVFNFSIVLPAMMTPGVSKLVNDTGDYAVLFLIITICLLVSFVCWLFVNEVKQEKMNPA
ncbi:MFS transporter [Lacibacter sp. MH-610]|uniref:MFS transporter n=1 Tax=Lacibacter sp. MH-610 TaxID=3020883 RepID=UPI0038925F5D